LRIFFADRRAVMMSIAVPIAIASFFGYIFGGLGGTTETSKIPVLMVDQDNSEISRDVFSDLTHEPALSAKPATLDDARAAVKKGSATVAIVVPPKFGAEAGEALFSASKKPKIGVLYDPSHGAEQGMVQGILAGAVMQSVFKGMFSGKTGQNVLESSIARVEGATGMSATDKSSLILLLRSAKQLNERTASGMGGAAPSLNTPYEVHDEAVTAHTGVKYNGYAHSFGGMGVQFILFMGIDTGIAMLLQRQRGLWKRFRAAPLSKGLLLGSRAISSAVISMVILMVIFGFARLVFGVRIEGSMAGFLGVCVTFSLMTAGFGLLVAALGKTPEATRGLAIFVTLIMVMLGGAWVPSFIFPQWLQKVTVVMPTRWAIDGLDAVVWRGLGFEAAVWPMVILTGSAIVFAALAVSRFRWDAES
jgi:ABC-2 type transport system permease protein